MKYVASFRRTQQLSPDGFDVITETMICDENTTLGQIHEWQTRTPGYINKTVRGALAVEISTPEWKKQELARRREESE
jgi:hypothetical protein